MSVDVTVPAWKTKLGNPPAKQVLIMLADAANPQGICHPDTEYIVDRTELEKRTVLRIFQVFAEIGLVKRTRGRGLVCNGRPCNQIFEINLAMLGTDLAETFRRVMRIVQGKAEPSLSSVSETRVCETPESVSETQTGVSETLPPYPLLGRTITEPSGTTTREVSTAKALDAASAMVAAKLATGPMRLHAQVAVRAAMEAHCSETGQTPAAVAALMQENHAAWAARPGGLSWGLVKWFGEGKWKHAPVLTREELADLRRSATARIGSSVTPSAEDATAPAWPYGAQAEEGALSGWDAIAQVLETKVNRQSFHTWLKPCRGAVVKPDGVLVVRVPSSTFMHLGDRYADLLSEALRATGAPFSSVEFAWGG